MDSYKPLKKIGVVGLGLMGSSIIVSFLQAGYEVVALTPIADELELGRNRIDEQLLLCSSMGFLPQVFSYYWSNCLVTDDYLDLQACDLVVECVIELAAIKASVYQRIEEVVSATTIIASNTSALPISELQQYLRIPERFLGIHWAEPAYATRFLEITCGSQTQVAFADIIKAEAEKLWEKEPTLLYKDVRGFITNRLMYAVYREAFHLLNTGVADMAAIDKCFQYDVGAWISLMGIFRRMDYIGLERYQLAFQQTFPRLCNSEEVPPQMQKIAEMKGRGVHNLIGLYPHTKSSAKELNQSFAQFNEDIYRLIEKYRHKKNNLNLKS